MNTIKCERDISAQDKRFSFPLLLFRLFALLTLVEIVHFSITSLPQQLNIISLCDKNENFFTVWKEDCYTGCFTDRNKLVIERR